MAPAAGRDFVNSRHAKSGDGPAAGASSEAARRVGGTDWPRSCVPHEKGRSQRPSQKGWAGCSRGGVSKGNPSRLVLPFDAEGSGDGIIVSSVCLLHASGLENYAERAPSPNLPLHTPGDISFSTGSPRWQGPEA